MGKFLHSHLVLAVASVMVIGLCPWVWAQESGLRSMNTAAPEFPPPVGFGATSAGGDAGPSPGQMAQAAQAAAQQRPAGASPQQVVSTGSPAPPESTQAGGGGITWINSQPLTMAQLRGRVVMIDFWEPTCINCIRTFPEYKKWWEHYHQDGFEIIGVEDPEFDIMDSVDHVREAVKRFQLPYPIAVDDHFQIWNSYKNDSWPNRFLIDAQGTIRYNVVGEGSDAEFERAIQELLKQAHPGLEFPAADKVSAGENARAPACGESTPEMYVGDWSGRGVLANLEGYRDGKTIDYQAQSQVEDGRVVLSGRWQTDRNGMIYRGKHKGEEPGADFATIRYHARELYAVMNVSHGHPSRVYITQDGHSLTAANKGVDVQIDGQGRSYIEVREPRMYYVVQNPEFGNHTLQLFPTGSGLTLNSFTFGNDCQTHFAHL
ncbi:MAG TPA: redoxin domain-containing protein [Terriglobia bacterium]|nr:redoxin domain-containing protein [Terriglobia bacterium]